MGTCHSVGGDQDVQTPARNYWRIRSTACARSSFAHKSARMRSAWPPACSMSVLAISRSAFTARHHPRAPLGGESQRHVAFADAAAPRDQYLFPLRLYSQINLYFRGKGPSHLSAPLHRTKIRTMRAWKTHTERTPRRHSWGPSSCAAAWGLTAAGPSLWRTFGRFLCQSERRHRAEPDGCTCSKTSSIRGTRKPRAQPFQVSSISSGARPVASCSGIGTGTIRRAWRSRPFFPDHSISVRHSDTTD